jgi:Pyruvate/2-oxoacid:ferredoxin oxidoreductase delta subunit
MPEATVSRRDFLATWLGRNRSEAAPRVSAPAAPTRRPLQTISAVAPSAVPAQATVTRVAIVQGRHCLAYQRSFCSSCVERCPLPGALIRRDGLPLVDASVCDGCGLCQEVCPAPKNAILLLPRRPRV